jgi:hypothetical protein
MVPAMPGLIGYMLAIVMTLGVYLAGLHWLVNPPDPWQSGPKIPTRTAQQFTGKKRLPPIVNPAEAGGAPELATPAEPDTQSASIETSVPVETRESETAQPTRQSTAEAVRPAAEPVRVIHREGSPATTRPGNRRRIERNTSRKLELMVLRTYERSDGKRFTRLLPLSSARNALAFQPDEQW